VDEREGLRLRATRELHRQADGDVGDVGNQRPGGQSCFNLLEVSELAVSPHFILYPFTPFCCGWDKVHREHGRRTWRQVEVPGIKIHCR
jgi:hypothetical protein